MDERKKRIFVDSDVVVLAFAFERDKRHKVSEETIRGSRQGLHMAFWNFLEVLGVLSYHLPPQRVEYFGARLNTLFSIEGEWPAREIVFQNILRKMRASDAVVLAVLEKEKADIFITWNVKDFKNRTSVQVLNPDQFLKQTGQR